MITMLEPWFEVEVTLSMPDTPDKAASKTLVSVRSTSWGLAPVMEVNTTRKGGFISGYKSTDKFAIEKKPRPIRRAKIIKTVVGLETTTFAKFMMFL